MKFFDFVIALFVWLKIFISPVLIGLLISLVVYINVSGTIGNIISLTIIFLGIIIGAIWATRSISKKRGETYFKGIGATSDLDPPAGSDL